ncbi:MAG: AAA family ATPase [Pseudomonadota bacterium]
MARQIPHHIDDTATPGERETLDLLCNTLPDDITVFHNIGWMRAGSHKLEEGEIDFIVLAPSGKMLLIEQKNGWLSEADGMLSKQYDAGKQKSIASQIKRNHWGLMSRLKAAMNGTPVFATSLLYCPDYTLTEAPLGMDGSQIIDKSRAKHLPDIVLAMLGQHADDADKCARITHFLSGYMGLVADPSAIARLGEVRYVRELGQLYAGFRQWQLSPYRVLVQGCAGSGKTYLAGRCYAEALEAGGKPLYVCFNRPLAESLGQAWPADGSIRNVHQLLKEACPWDTAVTLDNAGFQAHFLHAAATDHALKASFDTVIVDEGQDIDEAAWAFIQSCLCEDARLIWLEDSEQALLQRKRPPVAFSATVRLDTNYRNPRQIARHAAFVTGIHTQARAGNPVIGEEPVYHAMSMADATGLEYLTQRIAQAVADGFQLDDIVILTLKGRQHSQLLKLDQLGDFPLRKFEQVSAETGLSSYQGSGIQVDSIMRFKGCQAPVVFVVEADADVWSEAFASKLYCAMTRSLARLEVFFSPATYALVMGRLG